MQREKGDEAPSESREILDPTSHNQEKVVEVQKPIEKHESKVLKEYELFCSLSRKKILVGGFYKTSSIPSSLLSCISFFNAEAFSLDFSKRMSTTFV